MSSRQGPHDLATDWVGTETARAMIQSVPTEWEVSSEARTAWAELISRRAGFVVQETADQAREIDEHVAPLFEEYKVRLIRPQQADAFAAEVEQSAH
jgi:hypothetical protein